jgi:hypothetical protein
MIDQLEQTLHIDHWSFQRKISNHKHCK